MATNADMKTLFDTRPLKDEAWLKCKDSLDSTQLSGLEAIVLEEQLSNLSPYSFDRTGLREVHQVSPDHE